MQQAQVAQPATSEQFSMVLTAGTVDERILLGVDYTFVKPGEVDVAPCVFTFSGRRQLWADTHLPTGLSR